MKTNYNLRLLLPKDIRPIVNKIAKLAEKRRCKAYLVGGFVRDILLGVKNLDVDIAIEGDALELAKYASSKMDTALVLHKRFGTASIFVKISQGHFRIDITTARKERYAAPAAYPKVTPGTLRDDLLRRDFTINAMAMAITPEAFGRVIDPFGGARDLRAKRLKILHRHSFVDDPSRILRGARFLERFGLTLEPVTARALRRAIDEGWLARLNRGRLRKELERLTQEPDPIACLTRMGRWLAA